MGKWLWNARALLAALILCRALGREVEFGDERHIVTPSGHTWPR